MEATNSMRNWSNLSQRKIGRHPPTFYMKSPMLPTTSNSRSTQRKVAANQRIHLGQTQEEQELEENLKSKNIGYCMVLLKVWLKRLLKKNLLLHLPVLQVVSKKRKIRINTNGRIPGTVFETTVVLNTGGYVKLFCLQKLPSKKLVYWKDQLYAIRSQLSTSNALLKLDIHY